MAFSPDARCEDLARSWQILLRKISDGGEPAESLRRMENEAADLSQVRRICQRRRAKWPAGDRRERWEEVPLPRLLWHLSRRHLRPITSFSCSRSGASPTARADRPNARPGSAVLRKRLPAWGKLQTTLRDTQLYAAKTIMTLKIRAAPIRHGNGSQSFSPFYFSRVPAVRNSPPPRLQPLFFRP